MTFKYFSIYVTELSVTININAYTRERISYKKPYQQI